MIKLEVQAKLSTLFEKKVSIETNLPHITSAKYKKRLDYFLETVVTSTDLQTMKLLTPLFINFIESQSKVSDKFFNCSLVLMIDLIQTALEEEEKDEFFYYQHYKMYILYISADEYKSHRDALYDFFETPRNLEQNSSTEKKLMAC
jgi:hypothetical protein